MGKIVSDEDLIVLCGQGQKSGKKIILVAGIFDLLHPGHVRLLEQARDCGDVLVAAVLDDSSASALVAAEPKQKGARERAVKRPVTPAAERVEILAALGAVDYVVEIGIDSLPGLLAQLEPDVVVESAEPSSPALLTEAAKGARVKLVRIPFEPGHSTAGIIERIVQLSGSE